MEDLTVIILTYNEEKNIKECIDSIKSIAKRIVVIDSFSCDRTVHIAKNMGAEILQHKFINHAEQYIWGEKKADIQTKWVFRIDADERLTQGSRKELAELINKNENTDINGIVVRFEVKFLGKSLKHGGIYPFRKMSVYKYGKAYMENRAMDEHIVLLEGDTLEMEADSLHCDYKDLSIWIDKHNKYSNREVQDYYNIRSNGMQKQNMNKTAKIKRFVKENIYYKLPLGTRAHMYYIYRYYFLLGFLDGKEGKIFCFLQAYWYRFLVDAKIYENRKNGGKDENINI